MREQILHTHLMPAAKRFLPVLVANVLVGVPAYELFFVYADGFSESVGLREHLTFLAVIAILAVVAGAIGGVIRTSADPQLPLGSRAIFGVLASLALNSFAVGVGSIVSATHKDEGSVSADFTTTADVLVAAGLFVVAAMFGAIAKRLDSHATNFRV